MLPMFLLLVLHSYAATPQRAAVQIVSFEVKRRAIVRRVNRYGAYAAVLTEGGSMEGSAVTAPILVEHFSFGWQPLDLLNFRCRLEGHELGAKANAVLMRGMPAPLDDRACTEKDVDVGPRSDVAAVRALMRGPLIPFVDVWRDWAYGDWYGGGGGGAIFHKRHGSWGLVRSGGGAMGVWEMRRFGVPQAAWCVFHIYDAVCKKGR